MIYIIEVIGQIVNKQTEVMRYKIIDTLSESPMLLTPTQLRHIISSSTLQVANATIYNTEIKVSAWVNNIATRPYSTENGGPDNSVADAENSPFMLLAKEGNGYKIANYIGDIIRISLKKLREHISQKKVANCKLIGTGDELKISGIDTYEIASDQTFEQEIASKYKMFIAKSRLLGYGDISFDYEIENHQVKLQKYTGSSTNIILPSFIIAIMDEAFSGIPIEALNLNEGLQVIGRGAFASHGRSDKMSRVEIPSTVALIGRGAFFGHTKLINDDRTLNMTRVLLRNNTTIITR